MYLMQKNTPVLQFDIDKGVYNELRSDLLPYRLRNAFSYDATSSVAEIAHNYDVMIDFLSSRVLDLDRTNAKKLLNAFNLTQSNSPTNKARIAITCRIVSMIDSYWIRGENETITWESLNPKHTSISDIVSHIALSGSSLTLHGMPHTPELTGHGAYAKAWVREGDDNYLYKRSSKGGIESEIEVSVSHILDHFNVPHVQYLPATFDGVLMCKCKNMANDQFDLLTSEDFYRYCNRNNKDFMSEVLSIDAENVYKMCIVDYLVSNTDRHNQNWGFYINNVTGNILLCHPLYDHNNAFDYESMKTIDGSNSMVFLGHSQKEAALHSIKKCNFVCLKPLVKSDFLSADMYDSFMQKADSLGLYRKIQPTKLQKFHLVKYEPYVPTTVSQESIQYEHQLQQKLNEDNTQNKIKENRKNIKDIETFSAFEKHILQEVPLSKPNNELLHEKRDIGGISMDDTLIH